MPRSLYQYIHVIRKDLLQKFPYVTPHNVPRLTHIALHVSTGKAITDPSILVPCVFALETITGQHPSITKAHRSVAAFKLREGMVLGCEVTLRHRGMYDFLDRFVTQVLPRVQEFYGLPAQSVDALGLQTRS